MGGGSGLAAFDVDDRDRFVRVYILLLLLPPCGVPKLTSDIPNVSNDVVGVSTPPHCTVVVVVGVVRPLDDGV